MPEPREKLEALYEQWARGDFTGGEIFDPAVEMDTYGLAEPLHASGIAEVQSAMRDWLSAWGRPLTIQAEELISSGDRILALVRWRGQGKGSGVEMEAEGAHLWTFREGLVVRFDVYRDRAEARKALR